MMQRRYFHPFLIGLVFLCFTACTSVNTQDEESMMNMDQEIASSVEGEPTLGAEDFATDFSDDSGFDAGMDASGMGTEDSFSDDFASEDFGDDAFAAEDFGDESFEDFGSEPVAEQAPPAPQESFDESFEAFEPEVPTQDEFTGFEEPAAPLTPEPAFEPVAPIVSSTGAQITDIRYQASTGQIVIEADAPLNFQTRLNPDTNQFVIEVPGAYLPDRLKRPFLMKEFPSAQFGAINAYQKAGSATPRIVVQLKDASMGEPLVEAAGNSLMVMPVGSSALAQEPIAEPEPPVEAAPVEASYDVAAAQRDEKILGARTLDEFLMGNTKFYGRPISIQIKDADIRDVLNFIADESGSNLVVSDDVQGRVSIKLRQVPWDQALVTIMRANKLGYVRQGSVIRISKLQTLQEETDTARRIIESQKELSPIKVKVIPVSFAKVEELVNQFKPFLTKDRGNIVADPRTSSLIVTDEEEVIERISRLVKELDIPPSQVMIEGKVVEAGETFIQNAGVNWGFTGAEINVGSGRFGKVNLTPDLNVTTVNRNTAAADAFSLGLNIGTMDVLGDLSATLALAEADSLLKVISSPRIVTMNKEKATIKQESEQVTISTVVDQNGNVTRGVQRTPIVVQLIVTPQITNDANVILDVEVEREFAGALLDRAINARPINSRSAKTKILVRNGQTAVIGGIYQSDATESEAGVPVLKDIPVLGWLFKSKTTDLVKNELLIFLTPRILNPKTQTASNSF